MQYLVLGWERKWLGGRVSSKHFAEENCYSPLAASSWADEESPAQSHILTLCSYILHSMCRVVLLIRDYRLSGNEIANLF